MHGRTTIKVKEICSLFLTGAVSNIYYSLEVFKVSSFVIDIFSKFSGILALAVLQSALLTCMSLKA
jgi:hypothetical protein